MKTADRYRINRVGQVVEDTRRMTPAYLSPAAEKYTTGDRLYVPRSSSPARTAHPSRGPEAAAKRVSRKKTAHLAGVRTVAASVGAA